MNKAPQISKLKKERKAKTELESKSFKDGAIYLFKRADYVKPTWFCRVKVPGAKGYISQSTKTTDEHAAYKFADDLFHKALVRVASGQEINSKKTSAAIKEFITHIETAEKNRPTTVTRAQFLNRTIEFFGNIRLKEINTKTLSELNDWIRSNSRNGQLSPNTVKRYSTDLKQFFNWCLELDYIDTFPKFPKLKAETNRRPHFDNKDYAKLTRHLREFIKSDYPWVVRDRTMLANYVLILANTGIRYAVERDWLKVAPVIKNESERLTWRRRRHFTFEEYRTLYRTAKKRIKELEGNPLTKRAKQNRELLFDYILLLSNTGLRVDEAKTLIWRNVDWDSKSLLLENAGKTKSKRRVLMREGALNALKRIQQRRLAYLESKNKSLNTNDKIVALPDGTVVASLKKGFNELLTACGFHYNSIIEKHALTSLRHTYATFRLTTRSGNRASVRALAKQMGTSEKMIERHYGHDVVEDYRQELVD